MRRLIGDQAGEGVLGCRREVSTGSGLYRDGRPGPVARRPAWIGPVYAHRVRCRHRCRSRELAAPWIRAMVNTHLQCR